MRIKLLLPFFWVLSVCQLGTAAAAAADGRRPADFDRTAYYHILKAGKLAEIDQEFTVIAGIEGNEGQAYSGALLMRKAGLLKVPAEKLKAFKSGRIKLETSIHNDPERTEYHFLRLIIQEHAPAIVKYRDQLPSDRDLIIQHFPELPADLQTAIKEYSQNSRSIHPADLK